MPDFQRILRLAPLALLFALPVFAADPITGIITNKTTNKPAAGDDVVLIRLKQGMQESTRTKTDSRGRFTLAVPDDDGIHLVRVTHDKANYFQPATQGTQTVDIDVYNAAAHVKGVTGEADVLRIQTEPGDKTLRVVENFFIKNESSPPMTQFSDRPFEFTLPEGAVVDGSAALAPGGRPVQAAPVPLPEKGHYTFLFPIRPGETRFQLTYHLPYSGSLKFTPQPSMTTDTIAIMLPRSMGFKSDTAAYNPVTDEPAAQTYVARNVSPSQPLGFTLTGAGQLPRDTQVPAQGPGTPSAANPTPADANAATAVDANGNPDTTKFGGGMAKPLDPEADRSPWAKYKLWILSGFALLLAIAAGVLLRRPTLAAPLPAALPAVVGGDHQTALRLALREELFALETDRLQKKISAEDYAAQKNALDLVLLRALGRGLAPAREPETR